MHRTHTSPRTLAMAALVACACEAGAQPTLNIAQDSHLQAGRAAFGPAQIVFDWGDVFHAGATWSMGTLGSNLSGVTGFPVGANGSVEASAGSSLYVANWIDGDGFDASAFGFNTANGAAGPDLAIGGAESFTLIFATPVQAIGLSMSTGLSNLVSEVNHAGAKFRISTDTGALGELTLGDNGAGYSAWVTVQSNVPFYQLTFFEPSGDDRDQYFGAVFAPVPEPGLSVMFLAGVVTIYGLARRRRAVCW